MDQKLTVHQEDQSNQVGHVHRVTQFSRVVLLGLEDLLDRVSLVVLLVQQ